MVPSSRVIHAAVTVKISEFHSPRIETQKDYGERTDDNDDDDEYVYILVHGS